MPKKINFNKEITPSAKFTNQTFEICIIQELKP